MLEFSSNRSMFDSSISSGNYDFFGGIPSMGSDSGTEEQNREADQHASLRLPTRRKFRQNNQLYIPIFKGFRAWRENERHLKNSWTVNRHPIRIFREAQIRTGKQIRRSDMCKKLFALTVAGLAAKTSLSGKIPGLDNFPLSTDRKTAITTTAETSPNLEGKFAPPPAPTTTAEVESTIPPIPSTTTTVKPIETTTTSIASEAAKPSQAGNITFSAAGLTCRGAWMVVDMREVDHTKGEDDRGKWFHAAQRASQDNDLWPSLNKERATAIWSAIQQHEKNKDHGGNIPVAVGTLAFFPNDCEPWKLPGE